MHEAGRIPDPGQALASTRIITSAVAARVPGSRFAAYRW